MKNIIYLTTIILLSTLISCNNNEDNDVITYTETFDNTFPFDTHKNEKVALIKRGDAYSGKFYGSMDTNTMYSLGFQALLNEVINKPITKVKASIMVKPSVANQKVNFVIQFVNNGVGFADATAYLENLNSKPGEWAMLESVFDITSNVQITPDTEIRCYLFKTNNTKIDYDDLIVKFE